MLEIADRRHSASAPIFRRCRIRRPRLGFTESDRKTDPHQKSREQAAIK
jgi:hypothetical protein